MLELRFHGRAGQGVVTSATLVAVAAGSQGKFSKAFPFFGSEKRGPPVAAFCRIDDKPIAVYEQVYQPDIVVITDSTVIESAKVESGLREGGLVLVNTHKKREELPLKTRNVLTVDATSIALKHFGKPFANTVMLGALAKATGVVTLDALKEALLGNFRKDIAEKNFDAVKECYDTVQAPAGDWRGTR